MHQRVRAQRVGKGIFGREKEEEEDKWVGHRVALNTTSSKLLRVNFHKS